MGFYLLFSPVFMVVADTGCLRRYYSIRCWIHSMVSTGTFSLLYRQTIESNLDAKNTEHNTVSCRMVTILQSAPRKLFRYVMGVANGISDDINGYSWRHRCCIYIYQDLTSKLFNNSPQLSAKVVSMFIL